MSKVEKLSVSVTTAQAEAIRRAVAEGAYASSSDAVRDALRLWEDKRRQRADEIALARRLVEDALASGPPQAPRSAEAVKAAGRARLAQLNASRS